MKRVLYVACTVEGDAIILGVLHALYSTALYARLY